MDQPLGALDAIGGYAGQASVRPGEAVDLYVSTTAREFTVRAFRIGWYNGDLARKVWAVGAGPRPPAGAAPRRSPSPGDIPRTPCTPTGAGSLTVPTADWPAGSYLLRLDASIPAPSAMSRSPCGPTPRRAGSC